MKPIKDSSNNNNNNKTKNSNNKRSKTRVKKLEKGTMTFKTVALNRTKVHKKNIASENKIPEQPPIETERKLRIDKPEIPVQWQQLLHCHCYR